MTSELEQLVEQAQPDVSERRLARFYAEALLNAAQSQNAVDEIMEQLDALAGDLTRRDPYIAAFFTSGVVGQSSRESTINAAFDDRCHPLLVQFLLVLNEHDRLFLLQPVVAELHALRDARAHRYPVTVSAAVPLTDDQQKRLLDNLREAFKLEPVFEMKVDPDLLGGMIVRVADLVFDGSVRTQLLSMRKQLLENASHEIQSGRDRLSPAT
jgi:F-type H+-transporting ATPase subunit delta